MTLPAALAAALAPPDPATLPLPPEARPAEGVRLLRAVPYAVRDGSRPLELDLWLPDEPADRPLPVVVFVHGGAWLTGLRDDPGPGLRAWRPGPFARLARAGFAVACPDYRLSGEAAFPAQLDDLTGMVGWLRLRAAELGLDAGRIVTWGESAGGHLAALLALEPGTAVRGCVVWYAPADLTAAPPGSPEALLLGADATPALARAASPVARVTPDAPPFLILHGADDSVVPHAQGEALAAALRAAGTEVTFRSVPGADHLWVGAADDTVGECFTATLEFARAHCG
ncbi:alpha/beta hydrolase [Streptomyces sp. DH24]|uniref:alpha/beta hydrolase n=1 Tax=Streptomyces sp. DH24 TaxID=3040123 RepID=UPI002440ED2D|nr:alpha/beta hydrolase [Streptomyces sp. DH24]MDG9719028.1 alpha/beta hydrolase [Streptomyces sp. DH24]